MDHMHKRIICDSNYSPRGITRLLPRDAFFTTQYTAGMYTELHEKKCQRYTKCNSKLTYIVFSREVVTVEIANFVHCNQL